MQGKSLENGCKLRPRTIEKVSRNKIIFAMTGARRFDLSFRRMEIEIRWESVCHKSTMQCCFEHQVGSDAWCVYYKCAVGLIRCQSDEKLNSSKNRKLCIPRSDCDTKRRSVREIFSFPRRVSHENKQWWLVCCRVKIVCLTFDPAAWRFKPIVERQLHFINGHST